MFSATKPQPRKRRRNEVEPSLEADSAAVKKAKPDLDQRLTRGHRPPRFWDTLSKIRLSRGAIREFERRTSTTQERQQEIYIPHLTVIPQQLGRFARRGGPDLTHLRGFATNNSDMGGRKRSSTSGPTKETSTSSPYGADFEQKMIDGGIHLPNRSSRPNNLKEIQDYLARSRASLSPSRFGEDQFAEFIEVSDRALNETTTMAEVIPIILGEGRRRFNSLRDAQFTNMAPIVEDVTDPKPDMYDGCQPQQIRPRVREELAEYIIPSNKTHHPAAPNFFLEGKSAQGRADVAKRQSLHDAAVGARAMHSLQNYNASQPQYDGNAYSFSSTYQDGHLKLYATYPAAPAAPGERPEYLTTLVDAYALTGNRRSFCEGATSIRNQRDLAESHRNTFIEKANEADRHAPTPSSTSASTITRGSHGRHDRSDSETSVDEFVRKGSSKERHRRRAHGDSGEVRPRSPLPDYHSEDSGHRQKSRHVDIDVFRGSKRQIRPTQKVRDNERSKGKGRHEL